MSGKRENEIVGTLLSTFKSPDPGFEEERIVGFYDGKEFHVHNWALSRGDGLWYLAISYQFGPRTLEAIQRINPYNFHSAPPAWPF
jgi:hypothetical protein